jgi:hypothetical protein
MCKQAGRVQLEQSDLRLAKEKYEKGLTPANVNETLEIIRKPLCEEKRRGVEFEGHKSKAVMKVHPAMNKRKLPPGCLPCQNGIARNPETRWKRGLKRTSREGRRESRLLQIHVDRPPEATNSGAPKKTSTRHRVIMERKKYRPLHRRSPA